MIRVTERVYRTTDGRLVAEGDPDAAFLAHAVGDEVPDSEARKSGLAVFLGAKAKPRPQDKARAKPTDKSTPGPEPKVSGLQIHRLSDKKEQQDG